MRIAILSDMHANRQGLDAALKAISSRDVDTLWSPGDFVDYGADPAYVMDWAMENVEYAVLGNHDAAVTGQESPEYFNKYARAAIPYTREHLTERHLDWLENLPYAEVQYDVRLVHASPGSPREWVYIMSPSHALQFFKEFNEQVCLFGHTHVQVIYDSDGGLHYEGIVQLEDGVQYLVNPGSTGQPRDGDPRWGCAIYDTTENTVELLRGDYDIDAAAEAIYSSRLPEFLGERLYRGR
ncbi:MAG: metallophosphatase family protein [Candidatus Marinimicrobia bacterium]|nr:metallophosphatase family protein [Candidatus Neomarinimicrobiota bacterium]MCF7829911.1 metallophosphatase family protein [Candidatus Neomarinimicrobiota bacterium]MCF7879126.1 metallophosphatase family protein [Candidatus Neomarinimicrobiota bacterium]